MCLLDGCRVWWRHRLGRSRCRSRRGYILIQEYAQGIATEIDRRKIGLSVAIQISYDDIKWIETSAIGYLALEGTIPVTQKHPHVIRAARLRQAYRGCRRY